MLLTNGAALSRELYSDGFLSTITAIVNMATSKSPMGVAMVSLRTRFAGLHRPDSALVTYNPTIKLPEEEEEEIV